MKHILKPIVIVTKKYDYKKCDFASDRDINASINIFKK